MTNEKNRISARKYVEKKPVIAPSLLSANFAELAEDVRKCEEGGADMIHIDVMDGHFVPNLTIGPMIVEAIRPLTSLRISCHLMIADPYKFIPEFVKAGADQISVHVEGAHHLHRTLSLIKDNGVKAGIALNPATPMEYAYNAAEYCDYILLMSVNPGFGGQKFISSFLRRAELLKNFLAAKGMKHIEIEVDGGVKIDNVAEIVRAGANILVSGSGLFEGDLVENIKRMRENAYKAIETEF